MSLDRRIIYEIRKYNRLEKWNINHRLIDFVDYVTPFITMSNFEEAIAAMSPTQRSFFKEYVSDLPDNPEEFVRPGAKIFAPGGDDRAIIAALKKHLEVE